MALDPQKPLNLYKIDTWETKDGLPQNSAFSLMQTKDGYLWIATQEGLVRFNGFEFDIFDRDNTPAFQSNYVTALATARDGTLWIGFEGGGLVSLKNMSFQSFNTSHGLLSNNIRAILGTGDGSVWVGTDRGLNRIYKKKVEKIQLPGISASNLYVYALHENQQGKIMVGTDNMGLFILKPTAGNVTMEKVILKGFHISTIFQDSSNGLWVGTAKSGLIYMQGGKSKFYTRKNGLSSNNITTLYKEPKGNLWIGTHGGGLNRLQPDGKISILDSNYGLSNNIIHSILEDREGNLWIGTHGGGINRLKGTKVITYGPKHGLVHDNIRGIFQDSRGTLWIGCEGGGVFSYKNHKFRQYTTKNGLGNNNVFTICETGDGSVWFGTYGGGISRFKDGQFTTITTRDGLSGDFVKCIYNDRRGNLWVGTYGNGLNRISNGNIQSYKIEQGLSSNRISAILEDKQGNLWVGTLGGGINLLSDGKFKTYNKKTGFPSDIILSIYEDREQIIWIGGYAGLVCYRDGKFSLISKKDGLFDHLIYRILEDNGGNFWMSCNKGIFRIPRQELLDIVDKKEVTFNMTTFGIEDGMANAECNGVCQPAGWQTRDGKLWFPTIKGAVVIDPKSIPINTIAPPVVIEKVLIDKKPYAIQTGVMAPPGKGNLEIHYAGLSYVDPQKVSYKYILEGFTEEWEEVGSRHSAYFTNLSPGAYRFLVQAANNDGFWSNSTALFEFKLKPFFYQTTWFMALVAIMIILMAYSFYKYRVRRLNKRSEELEKLVDDRTEQLKKANEIAEKERKTADAANQAKSEFLARMSHEIRTPMNSIIGFADMMLDTHLSEEQIDFARTIGRSGEALIAILNDILDFSKIEAGELSFSPINFDPEVTVFDVCEMIKPRIGTKPVEILCRIGDDIPTYIKSDVTRFRQVLVNLMGNAAKFTEEGEIELSLEIDEDKAEKLKLHIKVRDTGIGIPDDKLDLVFDVFQQADGSTIRKYGGTGLGLAICKQIAQLMGGDVWVESKPEKGSTFHFTAWVEKSDKSTIVEKKPNLLAGKKVLILDDNKNNREILTHTLSLQNMEVIALKKPSDVIAKISQSFQDNMPIHICIIDIQMPGMSGYEVARQIRALDASISEIPLLAFSSSTMRRSQKFQESGFNGFLPKPIRRKKLLKMIERLLAGKSDLQEESEEKSQLVTQHSIAEEAKHSIHILLVEDNEINMKLAKFLLSKAGYKLTTAENGKEALETFCAAPETYDLILMDVQMPEMDGKMATQAIRDRGFTKIPIIAMTAESMEGDQEKCLAAGMNDYISKPIKRDIVFQIVKKWTLI